MTSRQRVLDSLAGNLKGRVPRQLWLLPWARIHHAAAVDRIQSRYPADLVGAPQSLERPLQTQGDQHRAGVYVDEWGAAFRNLQDGVIGEVREPAVESWDDLSRVRLPTERLSVDLTAVAAFCRSTDQFVLSPVTARPFERLQFLRGTENLYLDLMDRPSGLLEFLDQMHSFYVKEMELWASSEVDALMFMDDWGAQNQLLAPPELWRELFKPLYKDYIAIAHQAGKKALMHSDGHIMAILPDLIEIGLDAINSQLFCMGLENLSSFRGRICFWGEIDRQHLLAHAGPVEVREAVRQVVESLYDQGRVIAQCEFGIGARPENVETVFAAWDELIC